MDYGAEPHATSRGPSRGLGRARAFATRTAILHARMTSLCARARARVAVQHVAEWTSKFVEHSVLAVCRGIATAENGRTCNRMQTRPMRAAAATGRRRGSETVRRSKTRLQRLDGGASCAPPGSIVARRAARRARDIGMSAPCGLRGGLHIGPDGLAAADTALRCHGRTVAVARAQSNACAPIFGHPPPRPPCMRRAATRGDSTHKHDATAPTIGETLVVCWMLCESSNVRSQALRCVSLSKR